MMTNVLIIPIVCIIIIFAVLTILARDIIYAILFFCLLSVSIGGLYFLLNAPYVAVFQMLIYAGAVVVLFIVAVMLTARRGEE
ncbi:MAG: NADH-quinone oxidoreductase subunit J [Candidatus Bathyarchaeia archaeon]